MTTPQQPVVIQLRNDAPRPVALPVIAENIPGALKSRPHWLTWRYELKGKRWTKTPHKALGDGYASTTDPTTWCSFDDALAAYKAHGFDGIGIVLNDDLVGIDIDHVQDTKSNSEPWATEIAERFDGCYIERSPSGTGLRIFVQGSAKRSGKGGPENRLEVYGKDSPRYLTVTGHRLSGEVREASHALQWLHDTYMQPAPKQPKPTRALPLTIDDGELLSRARRAANGALFSRLYDTAPGDAEDRSSVDLSLCNLLAFWTNCDAAQMDRLFRMSALMREKWDERRGQQTYGERTIAAAIDDCRETYSGAFRPPSSSSVGSSPPPQQTNDDEQRPRFVSLDLVQLAQTEPEPPRFALPEWLPAHAVTLLSAHGSSGKSIIALHLAASLAAGLDWCGAKPPRPLRVLMVSAEDGRDVVHWRLSRVCSALELDMARLAGNLAIVDATECDPVLWRDRQTTAAYFDLQETIAQLDPDVLVLDNASDVFAGNEIDRTDVRGFMNAIRRLMAGREYGSVLLLGHVNKDSAKNKTTGGGTEGYSGSTAWHNSARSRWELAKAPGETGDDDQPAATVLSVAKSNYGATNASRQWRWNLNHHTWMPDPAPGPMQLANAAERERRALLRLVIAATDRGVRVCSTTGGPNNARNTLEQFGALPTSYRNGKVGKLLGELHWFVDEKLLTHAEEPTGGRRTVGVFKPTEAGRKWAAE